MSHMQPAGLLAALGHPARLRSAVLLAEHGELCVCELTHALDLAQPYVSRHLGELRKQRLVTARRSGQWIFYRLHAALPPWAAALLDGIGRDASFAADRERLRAMADRPGAACG